LGQQDGIGMKKLARILVSLSLQELCIN